MTRLSILLLMLFTTGQHVYATQMNGFANQYYQEDASIPEVASTLSLIPTITIGDKPIQLEMSFLTDIVNIPVHKDNSASWLCLQSKEGINHWFISDNEMGKGILTAIAIAQDGEHKECISTSKSIRISVGSIPLLNATPQNLAHMPGKMPVLKNETVLFYQDTPVQKGFTQSNTLTYYFDGVKVRGVIIGQITSN